MGVAREEALSELTFRFPFRRYQQLALDWVDGIVDTDEDDGRYHIVAPPGAGKTILGLELIARFARPALVLVPTTAIQHQWRDEVRLFVPDDVDLGAIVSTDHDRPAPITVLTYQVVSTTARADDALDELAWERWRRELVDARQVSDLASAEGRLGILRDNNPDAFRRELARRHRAVKRELLRSGEADIVRFLHPNARELLDRLVEAGTGTVVLDECHHLLDHWAVVVRHLLGRLDQPRTVGLTATLPDPDTPEEHENYEALLTDIDFQVPTPAVVKEGELAPYRDLVRFVEPTPRESTYLGDVQGAFEEALADLTADARFGDWLRTELGLDASARWSQLLREDAVWGVAGMRVAHELGLPVAEDLAVPVEAERPPTGADRAEVVARYGLRELKVSADPDDHERLAHLRRVLKPFGFVLTERGLRHSRSPGDLILAYSDAKQAAAADILEQERAALGERLRAVVVTDFERSGRAITRAGDALSADAGSARHTFRNLVDRPALRDLDPVLVTGSTLWVDADVAETLVARFRGRLSQLEADATCRAERRDRGRIAEIHGRGPDWSSSLYVQLVTEAYEAGVTRCLVGTRGLLGEGWDALRLNTLIDLTSVTTAQSVQQLRGRSLRLDPSWPRKVAHNWDVVCVAPGFDRGDRDLRRFTSRHTHFWGVVPLRRGERLLGEALAGADALTSGRGADGLDLPGGGRGEIVKGVAHVDPGLSWQLLTRSWERISFDRAGRRSDRAIGDRQDSYRMWGVGERYENAERWVARLGADELVVRTAHTISDTLRSLLRAFRASLLGGLLLTLYAALRVVGDATAAGASGRDLVAAVGWVLVAGFVGTLVLNARAGARLVRRLASGQEPETVAGDVGRALLVGLREAGLVSPFLIPEHVRVAEQPDGTVEVLLEHAPTEDARAFVRALGQALGPVEDPRYLIVRDERRLPDIGPRWAWAVLRPMLPGHGPAGYHPVPDELGVNRERAEALAGAWARYVGGGRLVYTRSDEGWQVLLSARSRVRPTATTWAFERWL